MKWRDVIAVRLLSEGLVPDIPTGRRIANCALEAMAEQPRQLADFALVCGAFNSAGFLNAKGTRVEDAPLRRGDVPVYRRTEQ